MRPGNHQPRRNCRWTSLEGLANPGGDWWHLGASVNSVTDQDNSGPRSRSPATAPR